MCRKCIWVAGNRRLKPCRKGLGSMSMMTLCADEQILEAYGKEPEGNQAKETGGKTAEKMIKRGRMTLEEIVDYVLQRYSLTLKVNGFTSRER